MYNKTINLCIYKYVFTNSLIPDIINAYLTKGTTIMLAKYFKSGNSQAVRIPKEYSFTGNAGEVYIKRIGNSILLTPIEKNGWVILSECASGLSDDFMNDGRNQPEPYNTEALDELFT